MSARTWRLAWVGLAGALWCRWTPAATPVPPAAPRTVASACQAIGPATAQRVRLKTLLRELSARRSFRIEYWAADDPEVARVAGSDVEVMTALANQVNLLVRYVPAGRQCHGAWRIDTVWVLPAGPPGTAPTPVPAVQASLPPAAPDTASLLYLQAHRAAPASSSPAP